MALLKEIRVPLIAVNDTSLTVIEMNFPSGGKVKAGEIIMVFETSKTTYDVESPEEGYIQYDCKLDHDYTVNTVVARIFSEAAEAALIPADDPHPLPQGRIPAMQSLAISPAASAAGSFEKERIVPNQPRAFWEGETLFSHEAIRMMESSGIGRSSFAGRDFVTAQDVQELLKPAIKKDPEAPIVRVASSRPPLPADPAKVILEKLSSGKKREISYLEDIQSTGLTSTVNIFIETEGIFTHINRSLKYLKDSLLPVIIYESSRLLVDYPLLNSYFTGDAIARHREINPGFAIDIDKGLKVLKIAGAERRTINEIEEEIIRLSGQYLDDSLQVEDLTDITFTITDLSSEGIAFFRPLINKMNSSILGVSAIDEKLQRCILSLSFDHRVTEGKLASLFLKDLKERLESYRAEDRSSVLRNITCFKCLKTLQEDLGGAGFARCITPEGKEGTICQSCLKGF